MGPQASTRQLQQVRRQVMTWDDIAKTQCDAKTWK
jgi:hypothetical protein